MPIDVFISHSQHDKVAADAACSALEAAGIRCWIAPRDVPPGAPWPAAIIEAIDHCRAMVLIFSSGANQSKQVYREVQRAFDREVPVIPLRIENVMPEHSLAYYVETVHWLDAVTPPLDHHLKQLVQTIATLLDKLPAPDVLTVPGKMDSGAARAALAAAPPKSGSQALPKWIFIAAGFVVAMAATAGLMVVLLRPPVSKAGPPSLPSATAGTTSQPATAATQAAPATPTAPAATAAPTPSVTPATPPALATPAAPPAPAAGATVANANTCTIPICGDWHGVGNTASVPFGGPPYCKYTVSLKNPNLEAAIDNYGRVTKALLSLTMVENSVPPCNFAPLGTRPQSYSGDGTTSGGEIQLELNPAPENRPQATASFSGQVVNGRLVGTLTVHRTDFGGNLAWTVRSLIN